MHSWRLLHTQLQCRTQGDVMWVLHLSDQSSCVTMCGSHHKAVPGGMQGHTSAHVGQYCNHAGPIHVGTNVEQQQQQQSICEVDLQCMSDCWAGLAYDFAAFDCYV
jgi:hypothetical protein